MTRLRTKPRWVLTTAVLYFPPVWSPRAERISLKSEPHHRLVLLNDFENVCSVQIEVKNSVLLLKHDFDAVGIMLIDAVITSSVPSKSNAHQKVVGGQLRRRQAIPRPSTATLLTGMTVDLLSPQLEPRNICASVVSSRRPQLLISAAR